MSGKSVVIDRWHEIASARDPAALGTLLHDDAVFMSPVVHTPQKGKAITWKYLAAALHVLGGKDFRYTRELVLEREAMLEFESIIDGVLINGIDLITWNEQNLITEFKVFVRPLKGINALHQKMGEMLAKAQATAQPKA